MDVAGTPTTRKTDFSLIRMIDTKVELNRCAEKTTPPMHNLFSSCTSYYQVMPNRF
jgi:hypothetical protein